ncbi:hypothetical protein [Selenomonas sp. AB3002]|jgi:hypothetical protein|uniref:hypothetical protein n=1 Tax=Selenomonas sp. AB3002 TaxID=1392502 RepID=UPI000497834D
MKVNIENPAEVRIAGMLALKKALGPVGTVRFLQQFEQGSGDYTKEKYDSPEPSMDDIIEKLRQIG